MRTALLATLFAGVATTAMAAECLPPPDLAPNAITVNGCNRSITGRGGDVRLNLGGCTGPVTVRDARRVHVYGGTIRLNKLEPAALTFVNIKDSVYVEGVHIDGQFNPGDGIRIHTSPGALLEVVNTRVERIGGRQRGPHGDIVHAQGKGPLRALRAQNLTGLTGYQGFFSPWRSPQHGSTGADRISLERVNISDDSRGGDRRRLWLLHVGETSGRANQYGSVDRVSPNGTFFKDVFVNSEKGPWNTRIRPSPAGVAGNCATFPEAAKVDGRVCGGRPPGGDFVPAERVGQSYRRSFFCDGTTDPRPDPKPEPKPEPKPDPKPDPKPEPGGPEVDFLFTEGDITWLMPRDRALDLYERLKAYFGVK